MADENEQLTQAYEQALHAEKAGDRETAARFYRDCLTLDPSDRCGASVRLASMGLANAPEKAPDLYIATLFNQHAEEFDAILTGDLGYAVPMLLAQYLSANAPGPYERMVDLGCGTGLSGMMVQDMCAHAVGVDLSEHMIDLSDERAAYDALFINEAVHFLQEWKKSDDPDHRPFDLIIATDTLPYIGKLEPLFDAIGACATPNARLAVSAETLGEEAFAQKGWSITPHQRFAHSAEYLKAMCVRAGFTQIEHCGDITVRQESGKPIPGYLVVASRS